MARNNRLNVLVGAELASSVTDDLNKAIESLKLKEIDVEVGLKDGLKKKLTNNVANVMADVFSHLQIEKRVPNGLGQEIGELICDGLGDALGGQVSAVLESQIKKIVSDALQDAKKIASDFNTKEKQIKQESEYWKKNKRDTKQEREWLALSKETKRIQKESAEKAKTSDEYQKLEVAINGLVKEYNEAEKEIEELRHVYAEAKEKVKNGIIETVDEEDIVTGEIKKVPLHEWADNKIDFLEEEQADIISKINELHARQKGGSTVTEAFRQALENLANGKIDSSEIDKIQQNSLDEAFNELDTSKIVELQRNRQLLLAQMAENDSILKQLENEFTSYVEDLKKTSYDPKTDDDYFWSKDERANELNDRIYAENRIKQDLKKRLDEIDTELLKGMDLFKQRVDYHDISNPAFLPRNNKTSEIDDLYYKKFEAENSLDASLKKRQFLEKQITEAGNLDGIAEKEKELFDYLKSKGKSDEEASFLSKANAELEKEKKQERKKQLEEQLADVNKEIADKESRLTNINSTIDEYKKQELETTNAIADAQSKVSDSQKELQDVSQESLKIEEKKQDIVEKSADKQNEAIKENFEQLSLLDDQQEKAAENQAKNAEQQTENINKQTDALKEQEKVSESLLESIAPEPTKGEQKDDVLVEDIAEKVVEAEKKIEEAKESEKKVTEDAVESKKQELDVTEDLAKKAVESEDKIQEASKETTEQQKKSAEQEVKVAEESAKKIVRAEKEKQDEIEKTSDEYKDAVKTFKSVYGDDGSLKQQTTKYDFKDGITETVDTFYKTKKDGSISEKQLVTVSDKTQELAYQDAQKANKELEKSIGLASEFEEKISGLYNKEFVDVDQLITFENAFDEIIDDIEKYQDNADGLIKVQERLNKLIKETSMAESAANSEANEQASAEKTERAKELRNSISAYNTLRKTVDGLYEYAGNFHIFDEEDAKRIISFENDLEDLYSIIKKDTASIEDLALAQKLLNEMQSKADSHASSLKNRSNQYDKETRERIAAENKLQKEYDETKKKAEDARKVVASSLESAKNILGGNAIHNDELTKLQEELIQIGNILDKDDAKVEELEDALRRLNNIRLNIDTRLGFEEKLNRELEKIENNLGIKTVKLNSRFGELFNESKLRSFYDITGEINKELAKAEPSWKNIQKLIDKANKNAQKYEAELAGAAKRTKEIENETQLLDSSLGRFVQFYWFGEIFRAGKTAATEMASAVMTLDSSMVELKKVTEETEDTYNRFLDKASGKAKELGITMSDYVDSVTNFARMGYDFTESQTIAETANIMQMVSENMTADEASEYMISIMAGFGIEAKNTMDIVDKLNNVSNNFSITTDGLGEALKRSSASMDAANNSLEETLALTAAANEVIQNPETVGNALKTVSMNFVALRSNAYRKTYLKRGMLNAA